MKRLKYRQGFTLAHYFDEWWDRVGVDFKVKIFVFTLVATLMGGGLGFFYWFQRHEKQEYAQALRNRHAQDLAQEQAKARLKLSEREVPAGTINPR